MPAQHPRKTTCLDCRAVLSGVIDKIHGSDESPTPGDGLSTTQNSSKTQNDNIDSPVVVLNQTLLEGSEDYRRGRTPDNSLISLGSGITTNTPDICDTPEEATLMDVDQKMDDT
jgi:hypothetical protein